MLTFFNNTAEDLGQTIQNLRDVSIWAFKGILLLYLNLFSKGNLNDGKVLVFNFQ